ncbi:MAG TPA: hypothetical protein VK576_04680, partial [Thermoleophilia bacterium]|nr:hypothetical protein [Thermoleophilia bacterium]
YGEPFIVSAAGTTNVYYWSIDAAGNVEALHHGYVNIDKTAPTTTGTTLTPAPSVGWNDGDVVVTLQGADTGGAGVQKMQYATHGSGAWTDADASGQFTVPGPADHSNDGAHVYDYRAVDNAGNLSATTSVTVDMDTTAPVTLAQAADLRALDGGTWHAGPLTVALTPSDPLAPDGTSSGTSGGQAATRYSTDGGATWQTGSSVVFPRWRRGGGTGTVTLLYASTDAAGNAATPQSATVRIDNAAPTSSDDAPAVSQAGPVTVHLLVTDPDSGPATVWYSLDGGDWVEAVYPGLPGVPVAVAGAGAHTLRYYAVDAAGNAQIGYRFCQVTIGG